MENPPHYDFRDILWAPAKALTGKKIFIMTAFLCTALAVYDAFTYLALAVGSDSLDYVWRAYGFFPPFGLSLDSTVGLILTVVGMALSLLFLMMGFFAISAIEIEEVRGYPFLSITAAAGFAWRRFKQIFLSQLTICVFVGVVILLFALVGLASRIPYVGEWIYAALFVIPGFVVSLLAVVVMMVCMVSVVLLPAAAAADRHGEVFTAILETFSTFLRQPVRWLGYTAYSVIAAKLSGFVYAYLSFRAVQLMVFAGGLTGGRERLTDLASAGLSHLPVNSELVRETFNIIPGIDWSFSISRWTWSSGAEGAVGYLMAVMLFLIFASIWGYMFAIIATAQARAYVALRFIKDDYRIDRESSLFYEDEPVNPPLDEADPTAE
jgi:hypothetical protein